MNNVMTANFGKIENSQIKMTSREIAEMVNVRHDSVKRTIETLVGNRIIVHPQIVDEQIYDVMGRSRTQSVYVFSGEQGRIDATILVAQLSPAFTAQLVYRWQELEKEVERLNKVNRLPDFEDPLAACDAWRLQYTARKEAEEKAAALAIENKQKEQIIVEQEFIQSEFMETFGGYSSERYKNSYSMNEFAKIVGCNPIKMNNFLRDQGVFMKKVTNRLVPMQRYADKFETIPGQYQQGNARIKLSCVDWLYEFLLKREHANPRNAPAEYKDIAKKYLPAIPESLAELM